jgi:hypothetical protein
MTKSDYLRLRNQYAPDYAKIIFILDPPASGRYFYNPDGALCEPLFRAKRDTDDNERSQAAQEVPRTRPYPPPAT